MGVEPCQAAPKMVAQCTDARLRRSSKLRILLSRCPRHWARGGFAPGSRLLRWHSAEVEGFSGAQVLALWAMFVFNQFSGLLLFSFVRALAKSTKSCSTR